MFLIFVGELLQTNNMQKGLQNLITTHAVAGLHLPRQDRPFDRRSEKCAIGCVNLQCHRPTHLHDCVVVGLHGALDGGEEGRVHQQRRQRRPRGPSQCLEHVCQRDRGWEMLTGDKLNYVVGLLN